MTYLTKAPLNEALGTLEASNHSYQKAPLKATRTKMNGTLFKCLAALCMLGNVTADGVLFKASGAVSGSSMVQTTGKAFGSSSLDGYCTNTGAGPLKAPRTAGGIHCWDNLNDGHHGNSYSWIPNANGAKAGVVLPAPRMIVGIQLARDLGGESHRYTDRAGAQITVEYSATANSDAYPWYTSTGWMTAGSIAGWAANTRNYYQFSTPVAADGLRITVSSDRTCIDELEIYASPYTFITTRASLQTAVQAYNTDPTAAIATYGLIAEWDVSAITDMSWLFYYLQNFNADISNWDTSKVTTMDSMFRDATVFNQPLSFDTSKVTTMSEMFNAAYAFNQPLSFKTYKVTDMSWMFFDAKAFNQPPSFDTSKVTDMAGMFASTTVFNQPLSFDTSKVTDMRYMFAYASVFNQPLSFMVYYKVYGTSKVTDMSHMFAGTNALSNANKLLLCPAELSGTCD